MIALHSPRLTALFGNIPLDRLTAGDIENAVQRRALREDEDLDFKRRYGLEKEEGKAEFAKDVAAFANARGGLILVGVTETDEVADGVEPVAVDDEFSKKLYAAAAAWLAPTAEFGVHFVPKADDAKRGFYLITVPRSPSAPHAVRTIQGKDALRFPRRFSSRTNFMTESEIAEAYRNRFRGMEEQGERLETVLSNGRMRLHQMHAWACMALVPNSRGRLTLNQTRVRTLGTWAADVSDIPPSDGPFKGYLSRYPSTRAGRVTLSVDHKRDGATAEQAPYAEFYADGSGFAALPLARYDGVNTIEHEINAVVLVQKTYGLVSLLMGHATTNVGLVGDAVGSFELHSTTFHLAPMTLVQWNDGFKDGIRGARRLVSAPEVSRRTVSLTALMQSAQERVAATHMLLADMFAEFGVAEGRYTTPDGALRLRQWGLSGSGTSRVEAWAQQHGVPVASEESAE